MLTVEELQERAVRYFCDRPKNFPAGRPYNCCESVLLALKDHLGVETDLIPRIGTDIGAGVSLNGLLCGSVSSIALAIGVKYGRSSPEEDPQQVWDMVDRYVSEFRERFGYVNCRDLTGLNLKTKEGLKEYFAQGSRLHMCRQNKIRHQERSRNAPRMIASPFLVVWQLTQPIDHRWKSM